MQETELKFDVKKADPAMMIAACTALKIKVGTTDPQRMADELHEAYRQHALATSTQVTACSACDGAFDPKLALCPYCGADEDGNVPKKEAAPPSASKEDSVKTKKDAKGKSKKGTVTEEVVAQAKPNGASNGAIVPTKPAVTALVEASESELDVQVARVKQCMVDMTKGAWALGRALVEISDRQLWKLRTPKGGEKPYSSFNAFVEKEFDMHRTQAWNYIDVVKESTPEQIAEHGISKLAIVVHADKSYRAEMEKKLKEGASTRELEKANAAEREARGLPNREPRERLNKKGEKIVQKLPSKEAAAKGRAKVRDKKASKVLGSRVTVAFIDSMVTVKLFKKGSEDAQAKTVGDGVWGELKLSNDVTALFTVAKNSDDHLLLKVKYKRDSVD